MMTIPCWQQHGESIWKPGMYQVSLPCVYNCFLVPKAENRSLSKAISVSNLNPSPLESTLSVAQWVWMAPLSLSEIISGQNFSKIGSYLVGERIQTGWVATFTKKITWNLKCSTTIKVDKQKYFSLSYLRFQTGKC